MTDRKFYTAKMTIYLTPEQHKRLKERLAGKMRVSEFFRKAVNEFLDKEEKKYE